MPVQHADLNHERLRTLIDVWRTRAGNRGFTVTDLAKSDSERQCADELAALLARKTP